MARWRSMLPKLSWGLVAILVLGGLAGAAAIIATVEINKHTSTEKFCTSCHSMAALAEDPHYQQSAHINNAAGVRVACGSCHIPTNNIFIETYTHITSGIRDVISEATTDFSDKPAWEAKRREMAKGVREKMLGWRNVTCTTCHAPESIKPASQAGQVIHASLPKDMACASCHQNLVHSRPGSLSAADEIAMVKRALADWVHSGNLSNIHAQKGIGCSSCHGNDLIPDANASFPNAQCATCHGGMEVVAQSFKGPSHLNPHASHLGNISCGSCHMAHQESKSYCLNCHTNFDMPIQGGGATAKTTK